MFLLSLIGVFSVLLIGVGAFYGVVKASIIHISNLIRFINKSRSS